MFHPTAIPTRYQGYTFRSRLEARWAVFFSALDIAWDYEAEGYILPDGTQYLPDFWLPRVQMFAEVKPAVLGDDIVEIGDAAMAKVIGLVETTGHPTIILDGVPRDTNYWAIFSDPILGWAWEDVYLSPGEWHHEGRFFTGTGFTVGRTHGQGWGKDCCRGVLAARAARFGSDGRG